MTSEIIFPNTRTWQTYDALCEKPVKTTAVIAVSAIAGLAIWRFLKKHKDQPIPTAKAAVILSSTTIGAMIGSGIGGDIFGVKINGASLGLTAVAALTSAVLVAWNYPAVYRY